MVKMLFRYSWKNKLGLISLITFTSLSGVAFSSLMMLSQNLQGSYDYLVENGNLSNAVIHELYANSVKTDDPNTPEDETKFTDVQAQAYNKEHFLNNLSNLIGKEDWRRFRSINYTGTNSGYVYKVIESDVDYTINKVVMYGGQKILKPEYDFTKIINDANWTSKDPTAIKARQLLTYIIARSNISSPLVQEKFVEAVQQIEQNPNLDPGVQSSVSKEVYHVLESGLDPTNPNYTGFRNKGYRLSFSYTKLNPSYLPLVALNIDNMSAYSLVAPQYVYENQGKEILPDNLYQTYINKYANPEATTTQVEFQDWLKSVPEKYKIKIDNLELLLIGSGMSPDFMYPVYDFEHATPNPKTEIISYGNSASYELIFDANRSAFTEDYLVVKAPHMSQKLLDELNQLARNYMSWPSNIPAAYFMNDTSSLLAPTGVRVSFLPQLVEMQIGLSNAICWFITILTSIQFIFTVKKFINDNKISLSILRANGFKKRWLVWLMPLFGLVPCLSSALISYTIAQLTQAEFIALYSNFWMIPTGVQVFNPLMLFGLLFIPFILMSILATTFTYLALKQNTKQLMSESSRFKVTPLSKLVCRSFPSIPIMTKFKMSIAFSSMPKLIAITTMFSLVATTMSFSNSLSNKFEYVKAATYDTKKYQFALDLVTPTVQGGGYVNQSFNDLGKPLINDKQEIINYNGAMVDGNYTNIRGQNKPTPSYLNSDLSINRDFSNSIMSNKTTITGSYSLNHLPSVNDSNWQATQINYLQNRLEAQLFTDVNIGGTNPWNLARSLMPANVAIRSTQMYNELWTKMAHDDNVYFNEENLLQYNVNDNVKQKIINKPFNAILINEKNFLVPIPEDEANNLGVDDKIYLTKDFSSTIKKGWYKIEKKNFSAPLPLNLDNVFVIIMNYILDNPNYRDLIYKVSYSTAILEQDDETYTKVKANLIKDDTSSDKIEIMGIKPDTKFIQLINNQQELINNKLLLKNQVESQHRDEIHMLYKNPSIMENTDNYNIIINESAAYQYGLKIGDTIQIDPTEEATRFNPKKYSQSDSVINFDKYNNRIFKFKVIDIITTYQNPEFYMNQRIANYINAMHLDPILNKSFYNIYKFNEASGKDDLTKTRILQIDPSNGIFSDKQENKNVSVNTILYSTSSLAPPSDTIGLNKITRELINQSLKATINDEMKYLGKISIARALGYVDSHTLDVTLDTMRAFEADYPPSNDVSTVYETEDKIISILISQYSDSPFLSSVNNVAYVNLFIQIFENVSGFINSLLILIFIVLFIISIITITMLATDFIESSIAICAILKAMGVYDRTNAMSFLSMFFPAAIVAIALSVPLTMLLDNWFKNAVYSFSTILLPIGYEWWLIISTIGLLGLITGITVLLSIHKLKKQSLTKVISGF